MEGGRGEVLTGVGIAFYPGGSSNWNTLGILSIPVLPICSFLQWNNVISNLSRTSRYHYYLAFETFSLGYNFLVTYYQLPRVTDFWNYWSFPLTTVLKNCFYEKCTWGGGGGGWIGLCKSADPCLFCAKSVDPPKFLFKSETTNTSGNRSVKI